MRRFGIIGICLFALAIWAQLLAPAAAEQMDHAFDPFSVICAHPAGGGDQPAPASHDHHCCTFCHAYLGGAPLDDRPLYTHLDYPVSSPLRWHLVASAPSLRRPWRAHRPRDPPLSI